MKEYGNWLEVSVETYEAFPRLVQEIVEADFRRSGLDVTAYVYREGPVRAVIVSLRFPRIRRLFRKPTERIAGWVKAVGWYVCIPDPDDPPL